MRTVESLLSHPQSRSPIYLETGLTPLLGLARTMTICHGRRGYSMESTPGQKCTGVKLKGGSELRGRKCVGLADHP